jgi:hypothetical protein
MLEVFIGAPPKRLLIFTGIAIPELEDSDGTSNHDTVIVHLGMKSNVPNPPFAATVGLASINNTDSDLIFATDEVTIFTDDELNLYLGCNIGVLGERSILSRFSYQATVFLDTDKASIFGTIRWNGGDMIHNAALVSNLFQIEAFTLTWVPSAAAFGQTVRTVQKVGHTVGLPGSEDNFMAIQYEIDEPPLGVALWVSVDPKPGAFTVSPGSVFKFSQVSGPIPITLNVSHLKEGSVDFLAQPDFGPH